MKANVKYKQQQLLSNKYSNHVVYLWVTIIHDKMINNPAHKSCAWLTLKTRISQSHSEYTRDGQSINWWTLSIIVYNKVTVKNADYQAHS